MIEKIPVSVYVLTTNNRRTIERCLKSLSWAEELVVVDSFSQDGTYEICKQYTGRTFQRNWTGHREQYQYAADLTTLDWIMFVDADEEIPPELVEEIRTELKGGPNDLDGYFVYRRTYYLGRWIRYGGWYPDGEIRLYRRDRGRWEGGLHARLVVDGKVGVLKRFKPSTGILRSQRPIFFRAEKSLPFSDFFVTPRFDSSKSTFLSQDFGMGYRVLSLSCRPCSMFSSSMPNFGN